MSAALSKLDAVLTRLEAARDAKVERVSDAMGVSMVTARAYLDSEDWIESDACDALRADKSSGVYRAEFN